MYTDPHVKYPLFFSEFSETRTSSADFLKPSNIKFHENSSCGNRVVSCGQTENERTERRGRTRLKRLVTFVHKAKLNMLVYNFFLPVAWD